jgi:hypothetical protein
VIHRTAIALAVCAAIVAPGCGGGGGESDELASVAPANAPAYFESVVRPEGEQLDAIDSLASRVGGIDDPGGAIVRQLDAQLAQSGTDATYENDIAPWLGERAALFFRSFDGEPPPFAVAFETTDTGAAQDFLDKVVGSAPGTKHLSYNGVDYLEDPTGTYAAGVVGDLLVYGTLDAFKAAVDASGGDSLADSSAFDDGTSALPDSNLALGYADGRQAAQRLAGTPISPLQAGALKAAIDTLVNGPVTFAVSATPDTASLDLSLPTGIAGQFRGGDLVGQAPANAWFSVGVQDLGGVLRMTLHAAEALQLPSIEDRIKRLTGVDPNDLVAWMRDGYAYVAGTSKRTISIGGVALSSDAAASSRAIEALRKRLRQDADARLGPPRIRGADTGFSATAPESPQAIDVARVGDQVVAALGPGKPGEDALHPKQPLADDPAFKAGENALGSDFEPTAFVSLPPFFVVAEKGGTGNDPDYRAARPYLQKLDYLIAATAATGDRSTVRFVVGVK